MLIIAPLLVLWLLVAIVVIAACRMAAASDARETTQSPRRASTWGTVRNRILTSPHKDQLATYR